MVVHLRAVNQNIQRNLTIHLFIISFILIISTIFYVFIVQIPVVATSDREVKEIVIRKVRLQCLSYDVASGSEITPCNKIDKPLVVYRFFGNLMTSITMLRT